MENNEKKTVIIQFSQFFAQFPIVLKEDHCSLFCQHNFHRNNGEFSQNIPPNCGVWERGNSW